MESESDSRNKSIHSTVQPSGQKLISAEEVAKHNTRDDCWVIISGQVYDVTDFLDQHPGGANVILQQAGDDAT
jgi:L-lactate dehydrogenase (cytochrome)